MGEHLLATLPSATERVFCDNAQCSSEKKSFQRIVISINVDKILNNLQDKVYEIFTQPEKSCTQKNMDGTSCNGIKKRTIALSERHLLIELINTDNPQNAVSDILSDTVIVLDDIPKRLTFFKKPFFLRGAISFSSSHKSLNVIGHYVAYCHRGNRMWEEYNDLSDKKYSCPRSKSISCQLLLYTV